MIKSIETTGKTTDAAIEAALRELGLGRDDVSIEVLALPKSGFLGLGASPAKVRVSYDNGESEPKAEQPAPKKEQPAAKKEQPAPKKEQAPKKETAPKKEQSAPKKEQSAAPLSGSREERTEAFLRGLLEHMDVECSISVSQREGGGIDVKLDGPNMGAVIGRRGETLDAIQHLVNYAVNRGSDKHTHINVDAEDYRSKREESLVHLAEKMAAKAIKYKRSMALEPMNSYERHVIHTALQDYEGVTTSSIGTEPNRRVVVNYERSAGESVEEPKKRDRRERPERKSSPKSAAPKPEKKAEVKDELPPDYPVGYEPPTKNKPQSREWC